MTENRFYPALGYACREEEGGGFTVSCYSAVVEGKNELAADNYMLSFILEKFPHEGGWTGHVVSLANMAGYEIGRDPSVGELDPGYRVFFAYAAREYYRSPLAGWRAPEVAVVSMVTHCQNSLGGGFARALGRALEKFPKEDGWRGHLPILVDTTGINILEART